MSLLEVSSGVGSGEGAAGPHGSWSRAMDEFWGMDGHGKPIWRFIVEGNKDLPGIPLNLWEIRGVMNLSGRFEVNSVYLKTGEEKKYRAMTHALSARCGNGNAKVADRKFANIGYTLQANQGVLYRKVEAKEPVLSPQETAKAALERVAALEAEMAKLRQQQAAQPVQQQQPAAPAPKPAAPSNTERPAALPAGAAARQQAMRAEKERKEAEREAKRRAEAETQNQNEDPGF